MAENTMQGHRIYPLEDGKLHLREGDYGFDPSLNEWFIRPPGHHAGGIPHHEVVEHEDKTITVSPSILLISTDEQEDDRDEWHGFLEHGVWREV